MQRGRRFIIGKNAREFPGGRTSTRYGFICFGWGRGDDRSSAASQPPPPPPPPSIASFSWYLGDFGSLYLHQPNRYSTRLVSIRFPALSLSPSLKDEDDIRPSQTGSSTRSFVSRARSNRLIALRSVAEFRSTSPC